VDSDIVRGIGLVVVLGIGLQWAARRVRVPSPLIDLPRSGLLTDVRGAVVDGVRRRAVRAGRPAGGARRRRPRAGWRREGAAAVDMRHG